MTKFQIGDTVRLKDQTVYRGEWAGDMIVDKADNGHKPWSVDCVHPNQPMNGAFADSELELVHREDHDAPTGGVILWLAVALILWGCFVAYIGYQVLS